MLSLTPKNDIKCYLDSTQFVNYDNPLIQEKALELAQDLDELQMVETIYKFVRDEISHSMDIGSDVVTFRATDVLENGHGLCFAKSNLLAALLRFMDIPTGFCYQKLVHDEEFILHGLNAAFINDKWVRMDARGNREGVNAQFSMDEELLAFYPQEEGEIDFPEVHSQHNGFVVDAFTNSETVEEVYEKIVI